MKKMAELLEELGFRPGGSDAVKKAFVKNLIKQAQSLEPIQTPAKKKNKVVDEEQLKLFPRKVSGGED